MGKKVKMHSQRKHMQPREYLSIDKTEDVFLPYWRIADVEKKLRKKSMEGYRLVSANSVGYASWRFYYSLGDPQMRDYYISTDKSSVKDSPYQGLGRAEASVLSPYSQRIVYEGMRLLICELQPNADAGAVTQLRVKRMHAALSTCTGSLLGVTLPAAILFFWLLAQHSLAALLSAAVTLIPISYHVIALVQLIRGVSDITGSSGLAD